LIGLDLDNIAKRLQEEIEKQIEIIHQQALLGKAETTINGWGENTTKATAQQNIRHQ